MYTDFPPAVKGSQHGTSLVEVIVFIIVVSVGVVGLMSVLNSSMKHSADPMLRKQALAVAEALLAEVEAMPVTFCDPNDRNAASASVATLDAAATDPTQCWDAIETIGPEAGETRGHAATPFDNVNDYNGFCLGAAGDFPATWICSSSAAGDIGSVASVVVPAGYAARVDISSEALSSVPVADAQRIAVTVSYNGGGDSIVLEGYRTRYAPNDLP